MRMKFGVWVAFLSLVVVGCGSGGGVVGTWTVDASSKPDMVKALSKSAPSEEAAKQMVDGMTFSFEFRTDGSWVGAMAMSAADEDLKSSANGTWKLDGENLTVTTIEEDGKPKPSTEVFKFADGKIRMKPAGMPFEMVLSRK